MIDVGGGTPHVEAQEPLMATLPRRERRTHQPPRGSRQQQAYRLSPGLLGRHRFPGAPHHRHARPAQLPAESPDVTGYEGPDPRVQPGRNAPLVLPGDGENLGRAGNEQVRWQRASDLPLRTLVHEGIEQVDRHRLRLQPLDGAPDLGQILLRQRLQRAAVAGHTPARFQAQLGRNGRRNGSGLEVVEIPPGLPANGEQITKAAVGDVERAHPLALEHRVGGHGGAMDDPEPGHGNPQLGNPAENGLFGHPGGRQDLVHAQPPLVPEHEVRKGTAGIDSDQPHGPARSSTSGSAKVPTIPSRRPWWQRPRAPPFGNPQRPRYLAAPWKNCCG